MSAEVVLWSVLVMVAPTVLLWGLVLGLESFNWVLRKWLKRGGRNPHL